ncbi:cupin domain-containing protein [Mariniflexile soesokkakense]|uniref:Cupin domain-containing protein n=1 Tax=Mariniflexile soesokkakense TaxID=1343160 RepID=A0ABV0ABZ5_9FLAO
MKTSKFKLTCFCLTFFILTSISLCAQTSTNVKSEISIVNTINDTDLIWHQAPDFFPNCSFTILNGDISKPNLDFFFKIEPNTSVISHTHNSPERMVLITGELEVTYEGEATRLLKAGSYAYGPAGKPHKAKCLDSGPCVLFIALVAPFDANPTE